MDVWGSSRRLIRIALVFIGVLVVIGALTVWIVETGPSSGQVAAQHFVDRLDHRDAAGAAVMTTYPNGAQAGIAGLFQGMAPGTVRYRLGQTIDLGTDTSFFTVNAAWHFGPGRDWAYSTRGAVRKLAGGWRISWDPQLLMPGLGHGRSARLVTTYAPSPLIRAGDGSVLMSERMVERVDFDPARAPDRAASVAAVAAALAPVAPLVTAASIKHDLDAAGGRAITAVTLRADAFETVAAQLEPIPGVVTSRVPKLLTVDRRIDSPALTSLRSTWQESREATAGWAVQVFDVDGQAVGQLAGHQGPPGPTIMASIDPRLQLAAEDAVVSASSAASIVMIAPSTGAVVAAAQNDRADSAGPVAFNGLFPVGDSIRLFAAPTSQPHHGTSQQVIDSLTAVGIGVASRLPGVDVVTGHVPRPASIESVSTGPDAASASTFGMAVAAATIARGTAIWPRLVVGSPIVAAPAGRPPSREAIQRMRDMLRNGGAAPEFAAHLAAFPGLVGFTGYAGDDQWFIGTRGDLAFAIHIADTAGEGSDAGARMAAWLFRSLEHTQP